MENHDVVVVGGGLAGAAAAIAAGRAGKNVLLIERYNCLGGAAAYDLVLPFMRYWTKDAEGGRDKTLSAGIFGEIVKELRALDGIDEKGQFFGEEYLKTVLQRMALAAGVRLLYHSAVTAAQTQNGAIQSVTVQNDSGKTPFSAAQFIDATGDANLTALAGFPFRLGREPDHLCQPMTLSFRLSNVDVPLFFEEKAALNARYKAERAAGNIRNPREDILAFRTPFAGVLHLNSTRILRHDPTDAAALTDAELVAREQMMELFAFLKKYSAACKNAKLLSAGLRIGARESRMIEGEYTLTKDDLLAFRKFEDGIAACNYDIDIHSPDDGTTSHYYFPLGAYYTIPYRCLVPRGSQNLLVAGRCVSATHEAQASLRIMPVCATLGEAAGTAAALAIDAGTPVCALDAARLRAVLRKNGAVID